MNFLAFRCYLFHFFDLVQCGQQVMQLDLQLLFLLMVFMVFKICFLMKFKLFTTFQLEWY